MGLGYADLKKLYAEFLLNQVFCSHVLKTKKTWSGKQVPVIQELHKAGDDLQRLGLTVQSKVLRLIPNSLLYMWFGFLNIYRALDILDLELL